MRRPHWLLSFIPLALALDWCGAGPTIVVFAASLGIVPLAKLMGDATETLAESIGPTWGGLLNASLGNAPEIIVSIFALSRGLVRLVKASITGAILGDLLFGLGLAMFVGGMKNGVQSFSWRISRISGGLLTVSGFGLIIPAVFKSDSANATRLISLLIAPILFLMYVASITYTLVTKEPTIGKDLPGEILAKSKNSIQDLTSWGRYRALGMLTLTTLGLAVMSELLTKAIEPASVQLGTTPAFTGVFLLAFVGNVADYFNAVRFASANKMDLALGTTVGSSIQAALLVAPVLVFAGLVLETKMDLAFSQFEVVAITLAVYVTRNLIYDGEANWAKGLMLIGVYAMLGVGFFFLPAN